VAEYQKAGVMNSGQANDGGSQKISFDADF